MLDDIVVAVVVTLCSVHSSHRVKSVKINCITVRSQLWAALDCSFGIWRALLIPIQNLL